MMCTFMKQTHIQEKVMLRESGYCERITEHVHLALLQITPFYLTPSYLLITFLIDCILLHNTAYSSSLACFIGS